MSTGRLRRPRRTVLTRPSFDLARFRSITRGDTALKALVIGLDLPPALPAAPVASTSAAALPSPLAHPPTVSASPQVPYQPSPQPLASISNVPYNASPLYQSSWGANGNGSGSNSRETSLRAQSKLRESRKEWTPTLKPYSFPKAQLRGTREGEPKSIPVSLVAPSFVSPPNRT